MTTLQGMSTTVALLFGGRSGEHGISCITAGGILEAIDRDRYEVIALGITRDGRLVHVSDDPAHWHLFGGAAPEVPADGDEVLLPSRPHQPGQRSELRVIREGRVEPLAQIDVVFPLLHGPYGEDGTIQGALDLLDVPYVGSGVLGSALGMDKDATKMVLQAAGIGVAPGFLVRREQWAADPESVREKVAKLQAPLFVKPARAGSSLGVSRVDNPEGADLETALETAFREDPKVLIEQGIHGREVECGVLQGIDGAPPRTTIPGEVRIGSDLDFYDYESKYFSKGTVHIDVPAEISEELQTTVRDIAARTFTALGLEGLARVDVFVTEDGNVLVNEVNTMPGFTPFSMFPVLWQNMGLSYPELISDLIEQARRRPLGLR